ncbi:CAP domain-containing protein [Halorubrum sp. 48-1-W]|uniref:CAP domain-containing protein n=1 Tax=Halorubrum sp. 48-1-W TaxID=2249761 RepID=UPI001300ACFF|nr:CAP domain-containing protein [Halorubrum sp. 48-1-W]
MNRRSALVVGATALAGCLAEADRGHQPREAEAEAHELINDARTEAGVAPVDVTDALTSAAREHSRDMLAREYYSHTTPEGDDASDRAGCSAGEILHRGEAGRMKNEGGDGVWYTYRPEELAGYVVEGWTLSSRHREILEAPRWQGVGVGVAIGDDDRFFATAVFC